MAVSCPQDAVLVAVVGEGVARVAVVAVHGGEHSIAVPVEGDISERVVIVVAVSCPQDAVLVAVVGE